VIRFVVLLLVLAAVLYAVFWTIDRRRSGDGPGSGGSGPTRPTPRGPVGPDDDDDFLRDLERRRRQQGDPPSP
jgi:hypothetical protein